MQNTQVKSHKRKGRVVKSHSRAVKGSGKSCGTGMSAEECKAKYNAMVAKYGENSPQAKKLAMKMDGMETVDKEARKKISAEDRRTLKQANSKEQKEKEDIMKNSGRYAMKKKHSRGDYMRKNVEEELLTKEAKKKHARTVKGADGKWKSAGNHTEFSAGTGSGSNIHKKINSKVLNMDEMSPGRKASNKMGKRPEIMAMFRGKAHSQSNDILQGERRRRAKKK